MIRTRSDDDRRRGARDIAWAIGTAAAAFVLARPSAAAPLTPAEPVRVAIELEASPEPGAGVPTGPRKLAGRIRFGDVVAPVELEFSAWPVAPEPRPRARIDVEMKKGERFFGLRRFAFVDPLEPANPFEPLVFEQLRREGVLAPRIGTAHVDLDGVALGVTTIRERISKELLESAQRREGVVFRLDPDALPVARLTPDPPNATAKSEAFAAQHVTAAGLLAAFLSGRLPASEVFDIPQLARFLAVVELWQAESLVQPGNLRFYFNPVTQRLEPLAQAGVVGALPDATEEHVLAGAWPAQLLADEEVRAATANELARLAAEVGNSEASAWRNETADRTLAALRGAGSENPDFDFGPLLARAGTLAEFSEVLASGSGGFGVVPPSGDRRLHADPAISALRENPVPRALLAEVLERHPFLTWEAARGRLVAAPGIHELRESLVLPEGAGLELVAGTSLRFAPEAMLVGSGPLLFRGTAANPIVLEGLPQGEARGSWQGIAVLHSASPHVWQHTVVRDTTGVVHAGWRLTAGVSLRAAEVHFVSCVFRGNRTEDALNLITSEFQFDDVSIFDTTSDAFDCDFCVGRVEGGKIQDVGGDGIDVSGSEVEVVGVEFRNVRDKAISVGERSRLVARNVRITGAGTAVAAKDASEVVFEDADVADVEHVAIMAYTKKREYGPGRVAARNIRMLRVGRAALAQLGSRVEIDGVVHPAEDVDIESLYAKGYMKK